MNETGPLIRIRLPQARADDPGMLEHEIRRPLRRPLGSDVGVPFLQAGVTALAFGVMAGLLAWAFGWNWRVVAVTLGVAFAVTWLTRLRLADSLLWEVERLTGRDLDHDGSVGTPHGAVLLNSWQARQEAAQVRADDDAQHERPRSWRSCIGATPWAVLNRRMASRRPGRTGKNTSSIVMHSYRSELPHGAILRNRGGLAACRKSSKGNGATEQIHALTVPTYYVRAYRYGDSDIRTVIAGKGGDRFLDD